MKHLFAGLCPGHEAGKNSETHLLVDLHKVFGQSVHTGSNLSGHRDGILCILQQVLWREGGGQFSFSFIDGPLPKWSQALFLDR